MFRRLLTSLWGYELGLAINTIAAYIACEEFIFSVHKGEGHSMQPTMDHHSVLAIDRLLYKFTGLKKGDIVVAMQPMDPSTSICKRITGVAGQFKHGQQVPKGCVWLEGDNKLNSYDSRHHGPLPQWMVKGKVIKILM